MRKLFHIEHKMDATAKAIMKWGLAIASVLLGIGIALSLLGSGHRLYPLHEYFAEVGMYVFAEGIIAGLLFDVIAARRDGGA